MLKKIIAIIVLLLITFFIGIFGLLIGMNIGGNFFTSFEFMGGVGYEATGTLGFYLGIGIGSILSIFIFRYLWKSNKI